MKKLDAKSNRVQADAINTAERFNSPKEGIGRFWFS